MDYPKRFTDAIDSLVEAFFDGTLAAGDCNACAVGNMCGGVKWSKAFQTCRGIQQQPFKRDDFATSSPIERRAVSQIKSTGYSVRQLARVEKAFEQAGFEKGDTRRNSIEDQHRRLMAVLDVLMDIEGIDEDEPIRQRFDHPELTAA